MQSKDVLDFYQQDSHSYDVERFTSASGRYSHTVQKDIVLGMVGSWEGKNILDVGAGTGRFSIELAKKGASVTSLDGSENMLNVLKQKAIGAGLTANIAPVQMDALHMSFPEKTFDGCICLNVINHVHQHGILLREISRVLKPGGFAIVNFTNLLGFYFPVALWVNITRRSVRRNVYSKWFTMNSIKSGFSKADLEIVGIRGHMIFPERDLPKAALIVLERMDAASRHSWLKYISGSLFVKGIRR